MSMDREEFLSEYPVVVSQDLVWGDMDAFRHINNKVYFRYFEDARIAFFDRSGVTQLMQRENIGPILARTSCNFLLPLDYPDRIQVGARATIRTPKTLLMEYAVFSEKLRKVAAEGDGLIVYYDYNKGGSCRIPAPIAERIRRLAGA
jgi:acyl-CoA thioester hydrolase